MDITPSEELPSIKMWNSTFFSRRKIMDACFFPRYDYIEQVFLKDQKSLIQTEIKSSSAL